MPISETTIPAGIAARSHKCWELIYPATGLPVETGEGTRHFDSRRDAETWADGREENGEDGAADLALRELDASCWLATAICGWVLDDELPMQMHHASAEEALRAALDSGMTIAPGGLVCSPDCDDCREDSLATRPKACPCADGVADPRCGPDGCRGHLDTVHDAICTGPGVPAGFTCSHPSHTNSAPNSGEAR